MTRRTHEARAGFRHRDLFLAACVTAILAGIASCGGDGATPPVLPPPGPPPPPPQAAPVPVGSIAARTVDQGQSFTVDVSSNFRDPDGDALTYTAESSNERVATARAAGSQVSVAAIGPGTATVTVTASDPGGRTAAQSFDVAVTGSIGDDFGSAGSLNDWRGLNDAGISVGGGVLSVTNRTADRLGIAERAETPPLTSWGIQASMGRTTRRASPGVVSLTGHRRFTASRLVLRTLDDSGKDGGADSRRASGNFEFALFDREVGEWIGITNMSGASATVREEPDEFTDIAFGHQGTDFVAYAGEGRSEELFRFDLASTSVDGVVLGDVVAHLTGVWLVNQGPPGVTALHDWVEVTGTGSSAPVPDVAEVAGSVAAAARSTSVAGPDADRAALVALYQVAGGPNWTYNDGWLTNAPLHDWYGVSTDGQGRVTTLNLIDNNLVGEIAPDLVSLSSLVRLHLSHNDFTGGIPAGLGSLGNLEALGFRDAGLTGEIPSELGSLPSLERLDIANNNLTGKILPELGDLSGLKQLSLDGNNLTGTVPAALGRLTNLTFLDISGNELTGGIPSELGGLLRLESLGLARNKLAGTVPTALGRLTDLTYLNVSGNELTGGIPSELGGLLRLEVLGLADNELTGRIPPELGNLTHLRGLYVNANKLAGQLPASLLNLSLDEFWWERNAGLCAPDTSAFRAWLAGIGEQQPGPFCVEGPEAVGTVPAQTLLVGESVTLDMSPYFRDSDGDPLLYSTSSSNDAITFASFAGTSVTITGVAPGTATVTVTASDAAGLTADQRVAVTVRTPNRAPETVGSIPAQSIARGQTATLDVASYFRDPDGDALTYTAATSNAAVVSAGISGNSLTLTGVAPGTATVTVTARDPSGLTAAQSVAVTVRTPNRAPEAVGSMPAQSLAPGRTATLDVAPYFRDPDGDALAYRAASSDTAVVSVSMSGSSLTLTGVAVGTATVTVLVVDPGDLAAVQQAAVTVSRATAPDLEFSRVDPQDITVAPGDTAVVEFTIRNAGNAASSGTSARAHQSDDATITTSDRVASNDARVGALAPNATWIITLTIPVATNAAPGSIYFGMCVDPVSGETNTGNNCSSAARLTISGANRAPQRVGTIRPINLSVGGSYRDDAADYFTDPDGDELSYSVQSSNPGVASVVISGSIVTVTGVAPGQATLTLTRGTPPA